ncbi:MAG: hypothetical protein AB7G04_08005 [Hyphomonadaceae bacterium]
MRALVLAMLLAACAEHPKADPRRAAGDVFASETDCAVIQAVLTQHYKLDANSPFRLDRGDGPGDPDNPNFRIACPFPGLPVKTYDHSAPPASSPNFQAWIKVPARPVYPDASTAIVETGSLLGPLAGSGVKCTLTRAENPREWRVRACTMTWIS